MIAMDFATMLQCDVPNGVMHGEFPKVDMYLTPSSVNLVSEFIDAVTFLASLWFLRNGHAVSFVSPVDGSIGALIWSSNRSPALCCVTVEGSLFPSLVASDTGIPPTSLPSGTAERTLDLFTQVSRVLNKISSSSTTGPRLTFKEPLQDF